MTRKLATDIAAAALLAEADPAMYGYGLDVLRAIAAWPHSYDLDECIRAGDITLDGLCARNPHIESWWVFYSVAMLEHRGYLPRGAIR